MENKGTWILKCWQCLPEFQLTPEIDVAQGEANKTR
jgi:hypothetical protein